MTIACRYAAFGAGDTTELRVLTKESSEDAESPDDDTGGTQVRLFYFVYILIVVTFERLVWVGLLVGFS